LADLGKVNNHYKGFFHKVATVKNKNNSKIYPIKSPTNITTNEKG